MIMTKDGKFRLHSPQFPQKVAISLSVTVEMQDRASVSDNDIDITRNCICPHVPY